MCFSGLKIIIIVNIIMTTRLYGYNNIAYRLFYLLCLHNIIMISRRQTVPRLWFSIHLEYNFIYVSF